MNTWTAASQTPAAKINRSMYRWLGIVRKVNEKKGKHQEISSKVILELKSASSACHVYTVIALHNIG